MNNQPKNITKWLIDKISHFVNDSPLNTLNDEKGGKAYNLPLVGFSNANNHFYEIIKNIIGKDYWLPEEIFKLNFPKINIIDEPLNIVCWILPVTKTIKLDNSRQKTIPAESWVRVRNYGEKFNNILRQYVITILSELGYKSVAPVLSPSWQWSECKIHGFVSNWSERHTAFVCGLGTFGLCDSLITPLGKAVRIGSVVTNAPFTATTREYENHHEYCLFFKNGGCMKCAKRCPAGAITKNGHDKIRCRNYIKKIAPIYSKKYNINLERRACGLCQVNTPCESQIPLS